MQTSKSNIHSLIFNISILIGLLLPHDRTLFQLVNYLLIFLLFITNSHKRLVFNSIKIKYTFVLIIILSFSINVLIGNNIEFKDLARLGLFVILFALFPFVSNVKISRIVLYLSLLYIVISQIAYVLNIGFLVNFYNSLYPYTGEVRGFTSDFLTQNAGDIDWIVNRRYGGIFHNPNQLARFVSLLLAVILIENKNKSIKKIIPFIIISAFSFVLSGSRSGFLVGFILIVMSFIYLRENKFNIKGIFISGFFILCIGYLISMIFQSQSLRVFDVKEGFSGSIGTKFDWFSSFFIQLNTPIRFFFGHFSSNQITKLYGVPLLDSEWGELFYCFGLLGVISLASFYFYLCRLKDAKINFLLLILLWCISSTVLFNYRMSFIFMLFLSKYYSEYKINSAKK